MYVLTQNVNDILKVPWLWSHASQEMRINECEEL